jgi:murein DD-endopeptidase MepM/ murein hydrolase activator NlpD
VGLPIETAAGPLPIEVATDVGSATATLRIEPSTFPRRSLEVPKTFVEPPPPEIERRQAEDRAAFARAFAQPPSPPLFRAPFAWPRKDRVTAGYGETRTFNGVKPGQHYGLDLAGKVGAPVVAANDGRVVLVRDAWASGDSVVVFHGAGLFTTYFHLSRIRVAEGEAVRRGQRIGDVGKTGRASGPHLHWGVRVGELYVDPRSVLRLAFDFTPRSRAPRRAPP